MLAFAPAVIPSNADAVEAAKGNKLNLKVVGTGTDYITVNFTPVNPIKEYYVEEYSLPDYRIYVRKTENTGKFFH